MIVTQSMALTLARPFGDFMVLPMERPVPIWGTANPNEKVSVKFGDRTATATADGKGAWRVVLAALPASNK